MITITGLVCLPLGFASAFGSLELMLMMLMLFSTMGASAVALIGSFGLSPGYFMVLLILGRVTIEALRSGLPIPRELVRPLTLLLLFLVVAVVSLWTAVAFFQGSVTVLGGGDGFKLTLASPYQFRRENFTQLSYLGVSVTLAALLGARLSRFSPPRLGWIIDRAMVSCIVVCNLLCAWNWLSHSFPALHWPHDFFFTNPTYAVRVDQIMFDAVRLSGPFAEPSALASCYSGFLFYTFRRYQLDGTVASMLLLLSCILILLLSLSSTSFVVLGIFFVLVILQPLMLAALGKASMPRITPASITTLAVAMLACVTLFWYVQTHQDLVSSLLDTLIFKKNEGSSYIERSTTNQMALQILVETWGVGIGVGSHTASSFLLTLISNVGIVGTLLFGAFLLRIMALPSVVLDGRRLSTLGDPLRWSIVGTLIPLIISGPNLSNAALWTSLGLQLAFYGSVAGAPRTVRRAHAVQATAATTEPIKQTPIR